MNDNSTPLPFLPTLGEPSAPFWQGGGHDSLQFLRCGGCGLYLHPPAPICRACFSTSAHWHAVSGIGTVESVTIRMPPVPSLHAAGSSAIAVVVLDEQADLRLTTNIIGCEPTAVRIGQRVRVRFVQLEDVWLPMFEPAIASI